MRTITHENKYLVLLLYVALAKLLLQQSVWDLCLVSVVLIYAAQPFVFCATANIEVTRCSLS